MVVLGSGPEVVPSSEHTAVGCYAASAYHHAAVPDTTAAAAYCCQLCRGSAGKGLGYLETPQMQRMVSGSLGVDRMGSVPGAKARCALAGDLGSVCVGRCCHHDNTAGRWLVLPARQGTAGVDGSLFPTLLRLGGAVGERRSSLCLVDRSHSSSIDRRRCHRHQRCEVLCCWLWLSSHGHRSANSQSRDRIRPIRQER